MRFPNLLALTDLSDAARPGLELAERLARRFQAQVTVGYAHTRTDVLRDFTLGSEDAERLAAWVRSEDEQRLDALAEECVDGLRLKGVTTVDAKSPREGVEMLIERVKPDAVVMATHGRTGMKHLLLGSVAEHTLRSAPCPVFVTRHGRFPAQTEPLHVLAGMELDDADGDLPAVADSFVGEKDRLTLAHIVQSMYLSPAPYGTEYAMPQPDVPMLVEASQKRLEEVADEQLGEPRDRVKVLARPGRPGPGLVELV